MFIFDKAAFPECHASTLVETSPGKLMAAWFGGLREKAKDVQIWGSHFDGTKWGPLEVLAAEPGFPTWNPVLFRPANGPLHLWYKAGPDPMTWTGFVRQSADDGKSWSKPEMLPAGQFGPVRAKPIQLADGTMLAGTSVEAHRTWTAYVDRSTDGGRTWLRSNAIAVPGRPKGLIQPTLFAANDGRIVALCRSADAGKVCMATSADGGKTFAPAKPTTLANPSAGIDAVKTRNGDVFLIYNPTPVGRSPLSLARSTDDGTTWAKVHDLETDAGEYSYPALIETADGRLQMTYTWKRTHIQHIALDPAKLRG